MTAWYPPCIIAAVAAIALAACTSVFNDVEESRQVMGVTATVSERQAMSPVLTVGTSTYAGKLATSQLY